MTDRYEWQVYGLRDPRSKVVRYVGVSCDAKRRLDEHRKEARQGGLGAKSRWIRKLAEEGLKPAVDILEEGVGISQAADAERRWVRHWRDVTAKDGPWLLNVTDGGEFADNSEAFKLTLATSDVSRMMRARVRELVDERCGRSPDGKTAFSCALRALTCARASELEGDSGAEEDAVRLLLAGGFAERTVKRAQATVTDAAVRECLEAAWSSTNAVKAHPGGSNYEPQLSLNFGGGKP